MGSMPEYFYNANSVTENGIFFYRPTDIPFVEDV